MKFGTYTFTHENLSLEERLRTIRAVGFDFIALSSNEISEGLPLCEKLGLPIENVHLSSRGTSKMWLEDDEGLTDRYCEEMAFCAANGVQVGIAHVTYGNQLLPPNEWGLRRFERLAECAEQHRFTLCFENTRASEHLDAVMERLKSPYVHYCYDSGHEIGMATDTPYFDRYLKQYGNRLGALHLHDSIPGFDLHVAPFDGAIDWERVAADLKKTDYGRKKLCVEPGGRINAKKDGKTAAELHRTYAAMAIAENPDLVRFYDGYYTVYEALDLEEILDRYLQGLKRLAAMIEAK
ncbi:MAG: sugar phosphate isomerase/epimerase [Clostridia bacterium]|nr:sugar phosphate isomerase/epimerase [Clostridia bacterium]